MSRGFGSRGCDVCIGVGRGGASCVEGDEERIGITAFESARLGSNASHKDIDEHLSSEVRPANEDSTVSNPTLGGDLRER
jgi:hypothetical protein